MQTFKNKTVAILGLSVEGLDSVKFFRSEGARIWCCDRRTKEQLGSTYRELVGSVAGFQLGESYLSGLERFDIVLRTPGMSLRLPELIKYREQGHELSSSTKLFFMLSRAPIIGVTGTKGKGTTSTLIAHMLKIDGRKVWLGGNVGTPLLSAIRNIKKTDVVVLELSSFQLEDMKVSPHIAVVLRTTQEHLANQDTLASNFHLSRESYVDAKKSIVRFQTSEDIAIVNADDETSRSFAGETAARVLYFSRTDSNVGAFVENHAVFAMADGKKEEICTSANIKLRGEHNLDNIAAASLAALSAGASLSAVRKAATSFEGLEHRLERVRTVHGVTYYNDSFSTVPETAIAALESFSEPIILIAGGSEKGSDFQELGRVIAKRNIGALIAIGKMTERIVTAAKNAGYTGRIITGLPNMHEIVRTAASVARHGDVVLLSPACASFDMFHNYKERGHQFKHEVSLL